MTEQKRKRKPKSPSERHKATTITMSPLKLEKHKKFSKLLGESLSEFYCVAADMRIRKEIRLLEAFNAEKAI